MHAFEVTWRCTGVAARHEKTTMLYKINSQIRALEQLSIGCDGIHSGRYRDKRRTHVCTEALGRYTVEEGGYDSRKYSCSNSYVWRRGDKQP